MWGAGRRQEGEAPSRLHQLSLLHNSAGHCQGAGVALPRRSLCSSRRGGGGWGSGQAWTGIGSTAWLPASHVIVPQSPPLPNGSGGAHAPFQLARESLPLPHQGPGDKMGLAPASSARLPSKPAHVNPSFGPTLTAWPLCQPQQLCPPQGPWHCPPLLVRTPELASRGWPALSPVSGHSFLHGSSLTFLELALSMSVFTWQDGEGLGLGCALPPAPVDRPLLCKMGGGGAQSTGPWLPWRRTWCRGVPSQWCSPYLPLGGSGTTGRWPSRAQGWEGYSLGCQSHQRPLAVSRV